MFAFDEQAGNHCTDVHFSKWISVFSVFSACFWTVIASAPWKPQRREDRQYKVKSSHFRCYHYNKNKPVSQQTLWGYIYTEWCRTCVSVLNGKAALLVDLSAGVSVRCLTALVRDSSFECGPCARRRECLFANSEGEKGKLGREAVLQYLMKGRGQSKIPHLFSFLSFLSPFLLPTCIISFVSIYAFHCCSSIPCDLDSWCSLQWEIALG